jgi:hypothetical protein
LKVNNGSETCAVGTYTLSGSCPNSNQVAVQCNGGCQVLVNGTLVHEGSAHEYTTYPSSSFPSGATMEVKGNGLANLKCAW